MTKIFFFFFIMIFSQTRAFAETFSVYTFPSIGWEHGGRSIGAEVYFDSYSVSTIWVQNAENRGLLEMKEKFLSIDYNYWTEKSDDSNWNRWRFGLASGYHWLTPEYYIDGMNSNSVRVSDKEQNRFSVGFSIGWKATLFKALFIEPSVQTLFYNKRVRHLLSNYKGSGLLGVKIGLQI